MPAQSRAARRRANTRQQQPQPTVAPVSKARIYADAPDTAVLNDEPSIITTKLATQTLVAPTIVVPPASAANTGSPTSKVARRLRTRAAPEPVDYTKDQRYTSRDLRLIALWAVLMFVAMVALYVARLQGLF